MKRLKPYDIVLLAPPLWRSSLRQIACHVVAIDACEAALEPINPDDLERLPVALPDMFMTFTHGGSLVALKGDLIVKSALASGSDARTTPDVRFRVTDGVHTPAVSAQLPLCAPVGLRRVSAAGEKQREQFHSQTIQLTPDRLQLEPLTERVDIGDALEVELSLPGSERPVRGIANVVDAGVDGITVEYRNISRPERGRLVTFIFNCHREALRLYKAEQRLYR
jgi:hypothetical protein